MSLLDKEMQVQKLLRTYRGVLIIGKSHSGKSTIGNMILEQEGAINQPKFTVPSIEGKAHSTKRRVSLSQHPITIIDCVSIDQFKTTIESLEKIKNFIKYRVAKISLIIFVWRDGETFTSTDRERFELIFKYFYKDISKLCLLVITGCENLDIEQREEKVRSFRENSETKTIASFMEMGIITVGFPSNIFQYDRLHPVAVRYQFDQCKLKSILDESTIEPAVAHQIFKDLPLSQERQAQSSTLLSCSIV